jgi:LAS superfamily LD-carboxypeptidase LdcB
MNETLIALGLFTDHLVSISPGLLADPDASRAFTALARRAASEGFDLRPASAFRDYDRQARIVNEKWSGNRSVEDEAGRPIVRASMSDTAWLGAILRYSALPGTSRHHWGTDLDIWDAAAVEPGYVLRLSPAEYVADGVFCAMTQWIDELIRADDAEGFYKPYATDSGGIAPEAWHISYRPVASRYRRLLSSDTLLSLWRGEPDALGVAHEPLAMVDALASSVTEILSRFSADE